MAPINKNLQKFKEWKSLLTELLEKSLKVFESLEMTAQAGIVHELVIKTKAESFKIMVVGQFKVGKSTFINALLGEEVLPAYVIPCTAVINEIRYGKTKKAILYFKSVIREALPEKLTDAAKQHINRYRPDVPPMEIAVDQLAKYVVITDPEKKQEEAIAETPYDKVELFWPLQLCADNVEIIDSPGLNENGVRTAIASGYLPKADAVLFVSSSLAALAENEMKFIDQNIIRSGHEYIFYIFNRFHQISLRDREQLINYTRSKLEGKTKDPDYIFFIDSSDALDAKINNDQSMLDGSGLPHLEDLLTDFLTNKKGKIKLLQPANKLKTYLDYALESTIPNTLKMLDLSIEDIEKRLTDVKPLLENLQMQKSQIAGLVSLRISVLELKLEQLFRDNLLEIIKQTPGWIDGIELTKSFSITSPKDSSRAILEEIIEKFQARVEVQQNIWCDQVLTPFITEQGDAMRKEFKTQIDDFYVNLENVKNKISGNIDIDHLSDQSKVSGKERVLAGVAGLLLADFGTGIMGASFGFSKQFFIQMAMQVTAVVTMILIGVTNPVTFIPVILAIALIGLFMGANAMSDRLKSECSKKIIEELEGRIDRTAKDQATAITDQIKRATPPIESSLDKEIGALNDQVEGILKDIKEGEKKVGSRKKELEVALKDLTGISGGLNDLKLLLESD